MTYSIFSQDGNRLASYQSETEAQMAARRMIDAEPEAASEIAIVVTDSTGSPTGEVVPLPSPDFSGVIVSGHFSIAGGTRGSYVVHQAFERNYVFIGDTLKEWPEPLVGRSTLTESDKSDTDALSFRQ